MEDEFNIIYSSGTTGLPKGIVQTHRARQHFAWSNALEMRYHRNTVALATTPLYSNGTFLTMLPTLFVGGTLVAMPAFDPLAFLQTVAREKVTHSFMVPTQFIVTLAHPDFGRYDLSSLEAVLSAGSPLRLDTKKAVIERMTPNLYEIYGISEGVASIIRPDMVMRKPGSVGTPVVGYHIAIIGPDDAPLPHGEVGEIVGYGLTGDAYHITAPAPDGNGAFRCMQTALKRAGMSPDDIDYINAHGTSTPLGDEIELGAVKRLFGNAAGKVSMSSTKSSVGHLLGAAGSVEAIFSTLAIHHNVVPPTLNLDDPCEGADTMDLVPFQPREREVRAALSNSFGFGGTNASLVIRQLN